MGTDWDAEVYQRVSAPQVEWGRAVLARLALRGDEIVLDAGCGTGRVTRLLAERVPRGRVIAVDAAPSMVARAREALADLDRRVTVRQADLLDLASVMTEPVEAILSTATFHWILDHDALFRSLAGVIGPGGRLVAQCGGAGNIARTIAAAQAAAREEPYAAHLAGLPRGWLFAGPQETEARLRAAGFTRARAWLEDAPTTFPDRAIAEDFLRIVVLRHHTERLPEALARPFAADVAARLAHARGAVWLDYVRLNLEAAIPG